MNDIRIYDYEWNLLHIEPNVMSAYWILNYNGVGTFEGTFPLSSGIADVVMKNRYLILVQGDYQALVTAYLADKILTVYGKTPNWILTRRTCEAFDAADFNNVPEGGAANVSGAAAALVAKAFQDVEGFESTDLTGGTEGEAFSRSAREPVSDIVTAELEKCGLGHRVRLDISEKKWIFEVYRGASLPLLVSEGNRNVTNVSVSDDGQGFFNSGWYNRELEDRGEWNTADPKPAESAANYGAYYSISNDSETENSRYPNGSYLVCTDPSGSWRVCSELPVLEERVQGPLSGIYDWDVFLSASAAEEAKTELAGKVWSHELKGEAVRLYYGTDYSLGDAVRVQVQKGTYAETVEKTVSGVEIWFENGNIGEKLKFKEDNENGI